MFNPRKYNCGHLRHALTFKQHWGRRALSYGQFRRQSVWSVLTHNSKISILNIQKILQYSTNINRIQDIVKPSSNLNLNHPLQLDLEKFSGTVNRPRGVTPGMAFLESWVLHMHQHPAKLPHISWPKLIEFMKSIDRNFNELNFGAILLQRCIQVDFLALAQEYQKFDKNPNLAVLSLYICLIGKSCSGFQDPIDEPLILQLYEQIKSKNRGVWDLNTGDRVVTILARTSQWRDCIQILEDMKMTGKPSSHCLAEVIAAAFRSGDYDLGWALMQDKGCSRPGQKAVSAWFKYSPRTEENLSKLFDYTDSYDYYLSTESIQELRRYFEEGFNYTSVETSIVLPDGHCEMCKTKLSRNQLTPEEFQKLSDVFLTNVLEQDDVFLNTSPREIMLYKKFIDEHGSFDIVLDGLNVAYCRGNLYRGSLNVATQLEKVVSYFADRGKKILVIGRDHMSTWPKSQMNQIRRMSTLYLIANSSQDDLFIIYAAMKSGQNSHFVSKDFLRNHLHKLKGSGLAKLFRRWRMAHQLTIMTRGERFNIARFTQIAPITQKDEGSGIWHIPFDLEENLKSPHDLPSKWLCVSPKKKQFSKK